VGKGDRGLDTQLRYARQIALFQLLEVNVVVDVYRFQPVIPHSFLAPLRFNQCLFWFSLVASAAML